MPSIGSLSSGSSFGNDGIVPFGMSAPASAGIWCERSSELLRLRLRAVSQPVPPATADRVTKTMAGKPGTTANIARITAVIIKAFGSLTSWDAMSVPRSLLSSEVTRVTMKPAVIEINNAGICETRPSPMVRSE
jgi:hypothetical protein